MKKEAKVLGDWNGHTEAIFSQACPVSLLSTRSAPACRQCPPLPPQAPEPIPHCHPPTLGPHPDAPKSLASSCPGVWENCWGKVTVLMSGKVPGVTEKGASVTPVRSAGTPCQRRSQCYPMASPLCGVTTPWGNHAGSQRGKLEFHSKKPAWDQRKSTQDTRGSGGRGRSGRVSAATPSGAGTEVFIPHHPGDRGGRRSPSHSGLRPSPHLPLLRVDLLHPEPGGQSLALLPETALAGSPVHVHQQRQTGNDLPESQLLGLGAPTPFLWPPRGLQ